MLVMSYRDLTFDHNPALVIYKKTICTFLCLVFCCCVLIGDWNWSCHILQIWAIIRLVFGYINKLGKLFCVTWKYHSLKKKWKMLLVQFYMNNHFYAILSYNYFYFQINDNLDLYVLTSYGFLYLVSALIIFHGIHKVNYYHYYWSRNCFPFTYISNYFNLDEIRWYWTGTFLPVCFSGVRVCY